ncbi:type II toxin-antitoxin system RelE/ParE family toxin [Synergistaceae bacterium OttesenSCG-928-I11]|nr:type II toxin-antitoxin system RelE/ParE family toxin [Synergistaceae bacterium OttesenSCG-928-I11]
MDAKPRKIIFYKSPSGRVPFMEWFDSFKDTSVERAIRKRLERLAQGNLGEYKSLGMGVSELKLSGLGLRIYFSEIGNVIVIILCGGDKNTKKEQSRDIQRAREYLEDFEKRGGAK